jgi:hypothetical protein
MKIYHPSFGKLSTHLYVERQRQNEVGSVADILGTAFQPRYVDFVTQNKQALDEIIQADRDFLYDDLYSVKALKTYSVKDRDGNPVESVQQIYLRAAIGVALSRDGEPDINEIKSWYDLFSTKRLAPPSPVMANAGIRMGQYATCYTQGVGTGAEIFEKVTKLNNGGHGVQLHGMPEIKEVVLEIRENIQQVCGTWSRNE